MKSNSYVAINKQGVQEYHRASEKLGVVPIITTRLLSFDEMTWDDLARISNRCSKIPHLYIPRLGESKSIALLDGSVVESKLVALSKSKNPDNDEIGFTFQITNGLTPVPMSDDIVTDLYNLFPEDLKSVIVETENGKAWLPSIDQVFGTDTKIWYDWYQYHNSNDERRISNSVGVFTGWWTSSKDNDKYFIVNSNGQKVTRTRGSYLPCICFSV